MAVKILKIVRKFSWKRLLFKYAEGTINNSNMGTINIKTVLSQLIWRVKLEHSKWQVFFEQLL